MKALQDRLFSLLRWSERYTKTDMVYLFRGSFWLIGSQFVAMAASLALSIAFAHLASKDAYGNYRYVLSLWGLCTTLSLSGIGIAVTRAVAQGREGALKQGFLLNLKWSLGGVVIALALAAYYYFFKSNIFLATALCIVAIFSPFMSSFSLFDSFLVGKKYFVRDGIYNSINVLFPMFALVATLFFTNRAIIFVSVFFAANVLADLFVYLLTLRQVSNNEQAPDLLSYSAHLSVMGIINAIADRIDSIMVFTLLGPANLAVYTFAIIVPDQIKQLAKLLIPISLPRFTERSIATIRKTIWIRMLLLTVVIIFTIVVYIIVAPWLYKFLFPQYIGSVTYSRWFALSLIAAGVVLPLTAILQAHKKTKALYVATNGSSIILIIVLPILTYLYGIPGAIISQFVYRLASFLLTLFVFMRVTDETVTDA